MTTKTTYEGAENGNLYFAVRERDTPASTPVAPARAPLTPEYLATLDAQGRVLADL